MGPFQAGGRTIGIVIGKRTKVGISVPQTFPDGPFDISIIEENLKLVESLGFDSVWTHDQAIGTIQTLDPFVLLACAAKYTTRVKLGISVIVTPYRSAVHLAKSGASLDQISGGRFILGLGIGSDTHVYPAFGMTPKGRVTRFEEQIEVIKALWTGDPVDLDGHFLQLNGATVAPKPLQKPRAPVWIGGHAKGALIRAVKYADGWMGAGASAIVDFKEQIKFVRDLLDKEGRDPGAYPISKRIFLGIGKDRESVRQKMRQWFGEYYHNADLADRVAVYGPVDHVVEELSRVVEEDLDMLMLNPVYDANEHTHSLVEEVLPKL